MNYRLFIFIKLLLLFLALGLASFLAFGDTFYSVVPDQQVVFVLDDNVTMNTRDVLSGTTYISRMDAAKYIIQTTLLSDPDYSYGLILFAASADYILPPTYDTGTFLLYLSGITTNFLPEHTPTLLALSGLLSPDVSYILLSDFSLMKTGMVSFPSSTLVFGLGSLLGDKIRQSDGSLYYKNGSSITSIRNDAFAKSLHLSYTPVATLSALSLHPLSHHVVLPMSERVLLYIVLGILVVLSIFI